MILHFKDEIAGFNLKSEKDNEKLKNTLYELGLVDSSIDSKGYITHFSCVFFSEGVSEAENIDLKLSESEYDKVIGSYTVPELNIENKSFLEVMNAVKQYYLDNILYQKNKSEKAT